jgi:hypothetical protein
VGVGVEEFEAEDSLVHLLVVVGSLVHLQMDWNSLKGMALDWCMETLTVIDFLADDVELEVVAVWLELAHLE